MDTFSQSGNFFIGKAYAFYLRQQRQNSNP
ncbi:Uncharacterised protein [Vibrio cholerae]|nr:Uncharacterised protein [Vibrio cholerae]